jgi:hypothetical protein
LKEEGEITELTYAELLLIREWDIRQNKARSMAALTNTPEWQVAADIYKQCAEELATVVGCHK